MITVSPSVIQCSNVDHRPLSNYLLSMGIYPGFLDVPNIGEIPALLDNETVASCLDLFKYKYSKRTPTDFCELFVVEVFTNPHYNLVKVALDCYGRVVQYAGYNPRSIDIPNYPIVTIEQVEYSNDSYLKMVKLTTFVNGNQVSQTTSNVQNVQLCPNNDSGGNFCEILQERTCIGSQSMRSFTEGVSDFEINLSHFSGNFGAFFITNPDLKFLLESTSDLEFDGVNLPLNLSAAKVLADLTKTRKRVYIRGY